MNLNRLLEGTFKVKASDLHLKVGHVPLLRVNGTLRPIKHEEITVENVETVLKEVLPDRLKERFENEGAADFAYSLPPSGRFRVAAFHQRGNISITFRRIDSTPPILEDLNLPGPVARFADVMRGLVLVTGITGSGKSTTLASIINRINKKHKKHIVTIEDPIEYVYKDELSLINQIEVGPDTPSFGVTMARILRFDPDVIMVGEMRDRETVETGIEAVDTGHMVFSTLHTSDAKQTINRLLHFFDQREEEMILELLALNLRAIVSQRLISRTDSPGLVPACEVLLNTPIVTKLINEGRIAEIEQVLKNGEDGMQSFDMSLAKMVKDGWIDIDTAMSQAADESAMRRMVRGEFSAGDRSGLIR
ncbi:MAG: type IV pilus twitching motility protein PilT [Candidatus Sumerlaeia bacterium]